MKNIKKIFYITILLLMAFSNVVYARDTEDADTAQILKQQQEELEIADFLKLSEEYTKQNLDDVDMNHVFQSAIAGKVGNTNLWNNVLNIFGQEFKTAVSSIRHYINYYCHP